MYNIIDLFAGAGGLSLGFMQTKAFNIKVAFENNLNAQRTYKKNHPNTDVFGDVREADYKKIKSDYGQIDVVIGGPPCQGFSNANRQRTHTINKNNILVKEYVRAITELEPKAFVMENVSMLKSNVHRFYLSDEDDNTVKTYKIECSDTEIFIIDKKYKTKELVEVIDKPQSIDKKIWKADDLKSLEVLYRQRNNIEKCKKALIKHKNKLEKLAGNIVREDYPNISNLNIDIAETLCGYYNKEIFEKELINKIEKLIMVQRALYKAKELFDNNLKIEKYSTEENIVVTVKSYSVLDYIRQILESDKYGYTLAYDVLCAADFGAPQKRNRFVIIGVKNDISNTVNLPIGSYNEENYNTVKDAIYDLAEEKVIKNISEDRGTKRENPKIELTALAGELRDSSVLYNHIITDTREVAMNRFKKIKQGENFHSLEEEMKNDTYTDTSRTQNTIYLRLKYNQPSGTVVNVRKSMWIHPEIDRAISVREAARLQTFPDSFIFKGTKDSQYQQVGNAVPPMLAKAIANKILELLCSV